MSEKKQPEKRSKVKLNARVDDQLKRRVLQWQQENRLSEFSQAVIELLERGLSKDSDSLNLQICNYRSEIPAYYLKFVRCTRDHKVITEEQCEGCSLYQILRVPLMSLEKVKREVQNLRKEEQTVRTVVEKLDSNTEAELRKEIRRLNQNWKLTQETLREKTSSREEMPKSQVLKRTIEEKKTTEEYVPSPEAKPLSQLILCPKIRDHVSIEDVCKKTCLEKDACLYFQEIVVNKAFQI